MAEPTLQEIFGTGASQDLASLTIDKTDLTAVGLTADANNTGESLLIAVLLKAREYLTQANYDANLDQSVLVDDGLPSFLNRGVDSTPYRTDQLTVTLSKVDTNQIINPDDY
ncbi:hypothetical protein [Calothrix sp. CCY 0018]|uniref:hypothetical protein n=1 Tax=Calothrix sp. CCY 0018 TaxID=3103864 RepID=UPI0039C62F01